jgi:hypothetical protein
VGAAVFDRTKRGTARPAVAGFSGGGWDSEGGDEYAANIEAAAQADSRDYAELPGGERRADSAAADTQAGISDCDAKQF